MKYNWIQAGFFIVSDGWAPERVNKVLPARIVTASTCIADSYPDKWAFPLDKTPENELHNIQESLALNDSSFTDLCSWVNSAMDNEEFGYPNVFFTLDKAREFRKLFLKAVGSTRLIGLSLEKQEAEEFVREAATEPGFGVLTILTRNLQLKPDIAPIGFDILGAEYGGWTFHTFSCNGLEVSYSEKLGISFNEFGLIPEYPKAVAACEYTNREDVGSEPVAWYPFRVDLYENWE